MDEPEEPAAVPPAGHPGPAAAARPPSPPAVALPRYPGIRATLGASFDLSLAASREIRRTSIHVGLLVVALVGPPLVLLLAMIRELGGLEALFRELDPLARALGTPEPDSVTMLRLGTLLGAVGLLAVLVESPILAIGLLGARATGRSWGLRQALRLSRARFWRVLAAGLLAAIPGLVASWLIDAVSPSRTLADEQLTALGQIVAGTLVSLPFAYYLAGIVLGGVGAIESVRRSARIARARWRLPLLIAAVGIVAQLIALFAFGAGIDALARLGIALGLRLDGSLELAATTVVVLLVGLAAVGSLTVTILALTLAPQVVAFLGMTGYADGLDHEAAARGPARLVSIPMAAVIGLGVLVALAGLASL